MFRTLMYPSSQSLRLFCWITTLFVLLLVWCVLEFRCDWDGVVSVLQAYLWSGACDYSVELPHWFYCTWFDMCWSFGVVGMEWYSSQPHWNSNTHRTKNNTTNVVIQQSSRKLLMMDILMSETFLAHKKWNKIASDIKLVFYSSAITMMHGPITIRSLLILVADFWFTLILCNNLTLLQTSGFLH